MHLLPTCVFSSSEPVMFTWITLFDSFNSVNCPPPCKTLLWPISRNSIHIGHWTKTDVEIKSLIFLKDGKSACKKPTAAQNWWVIDICAACHVWRMLKGAGFDHLEPWCLNQDPLENTSCVIHLHIGSNNNITVERFVDAMKTNISSGPASTNLHNSNCEDYDTKLLDNLHSFLEE